MKIVIDLTAEVTEMEDAEIHRDLKLSALSVNPPFPQRLNSAKQILKFLWFSTLYNYKF